MITALEEANDEISIIDIDIGELLKIHIEKNRFHIMANDARCQQKYVN